MNDFNMLSQGHNQCASRATSMVKTTPVNFDCPMMDTHTSTCLEECKSNSFAFRDPHIGRIISLMPSEREYPSIEKMSRTSSFPIIANGSLAQQRNSSCPDIPISLSASARNVFARRSRQEECKANATFPVVKTRLTKGTVLINGSLKDRFDGKFSGSPRLGVSVKVNRDGPMKQLIREEDSGYFQ